jgi:hypothetical protein
MHEVSQDRSQRNTLNKINGANAIEHHCVLKAMKGQTNMVYIQVQANISIGRSRVQVLGVLQRVQAISQQCIEG